MPAPPSTQGNPDRDAKKEAMEKAVAESRARRKAVEDAALAAARAVNNGATPEERCGGVRDAWRAMRDTVMENRKR